MAAAALGGLARIAVAAGFRVAIMDLRGHGDSDHSFAEYGDGPTAGDIEALARELGGPAMLVGNSMAAGSAVLVQPSIRNWSAVWCCSARSSANQKPPD